WDSLPDLQERPERKAWTKTCSMPDCEQPVVAKGFCDKHYRRFHKYGDPVQNARKDDIPAQGTCSFSDCRRPVYCRGLCSFHYNRQRLHGDPGWTPQGSKYAGVTCSIPGCSRPARKRGWCACHYTRWMNHGDPLYDVH